MKAPFAASILVASTLLPALAPAFTLTQWQQDGTAVSSAPGGQGAPRIVSDGAGGVFVVFLENSTGLGWDLRIQRMNAYGLTYWAIDGVLLTGAANDQLNPTLTPDGAGGVIVTWWDTRSGDADIYAQRVNAFGVMQWTTDGVPVCTAAGNQFNPVIASDGAGGAIIGWTDYRSGTTDIYAQRVDASGVAQWAANGAGVCTAVNSQDLVVAVSDGAGGAIFAWADDRNGTDSDIYVQRVDASGGAQWTPGGVVLAIQADYQVYPRIVGDGAGGAIVTWHDGSGMGVGDIWAQKVDAFGLLPWGPNALGVCQIVGEQTAPEIVSDGAGGAIIAWDDFRNGLDWDLYVQRISGAGAPQWTGDGVALCTAGNDQSYPRLASDGAGGAVVTWQDLRNDLGDVYAQRITGAGKVMWTSEGELVCGAANTQVFPEPARDGAGGVIITWGDARTHVADVYAQRVDLRHGYWGHPEPLLAGVADVPQDQGGKVRVNWFASGRDSLNDQIISHYSVWRAASAAAVQAAAAAGVPRVGLAEVGEAFAGPAIREETTAAGSSFWELVGTQDAIYLGAYSFTAPTGYDSTLAGSADHDFQVVAHAYGSQYLNWPSNVASGHSVDNLAPAAPLYLTAQRVGSDVQLKWNRVRVVDLKNYALYRAGSSGVTPVPMNFLADSTDSLATDSNAPGSALYYIVTARDVHENQSAASNEASVGALTGVGDTPALVRRLTVRPNHPNPFTGETQLEIGLPEAGAIRVEVYDVAGRRVRTMGVPGVRGWQSVTFRGVNDGGHPLASGVYFYRVGVGGSTITRKMLITR